MLKVLLGLALLAHMSYATDSPVSSAPPGSKAELEFVGDFTYEEIDSTEYGIEDFLIECTMELETVSCTGIENSVSDCSFTVTIESDNVAAVQEVSADIAANGFTLETFGSYTQYDGVCPSNPNFCNDVVEDNQCNYCRCKGLATSSAVVYDTLFQCFDATLNNGLPSVMYRFKSDGTVKCLGHQVCTGNNVKTGIKNDWHISNLFCATTGTGICNPDNFVETVQCTNCRCRTVSTSDAVVYDNVQDCSDAAFTAGHSALTYYTKSNGKVKCVTHSTCTGNDVKSGTNHPWQISNVACTD